MEQISSSQVTPAIWSLFRPAEMVISRCYQVLEGVVGHGKILVDNLQAPTWAVVQEPITNHSKEKPDDPQLC